MTVKNLTLKTFGDHYICDCGNHSGLDGFHPSNEKGELMEPTSNWDSHYSCGKCHSVIKLEGSE